MALNWSGLLRGELLLTANLLLGAVLGEAILRFRLARWLLKPLKTLLDRRGISSILAASMAVSVGSPKAAAALVAASYRNGEISRPEALWGTLCLAFPAYLKRWPATAVTAFAMAGKVGFLFSLIVLLRSGLRFVWFLRRLPLGRSGPAALDAKKAARSVWKSLVRTLPVAWAFFALTYGMIPWLETAMKGSLSGSLLPLAGWTVAASGVGSLAASLAAAGGALASGDLRPAEALFALLLGSGLGSVIRSLRQNSAYWLGLFPLELVKPLLFWNVGTTMAAALLSLLPAVFFL